jgi:glycosyltransferase involved in cell wall biosynthesis
MNGSAAVAARSPKGASAAAAPMLLDSSRLAGRFVKGLRATGIDRVCLAYQARYRASARALLGLGARQRVLAHGGSQRLFDLLGGAAAAARAPQAGRLGRGLALARTLLPARRPAQAAAETARADGSGTAPWLLNVGHSGLEDPGYGRWLATRRVRPVFMVHDLIPVTHPDFALPGGAALHRQRLATMLRWGQGLVLNSQATLEALRQYAHDAALPLPPFVVSPLGLDLPAAAGEATPVAVHAPGAAAPWAAGGPGTTPRPYFVMLGTIEARKGHAAMLQLWRQLVQELGACAAPRLLVIGRRGWKAESAIELLDRCHALRGVVFELPGCGDAELAAWLRGANGLLFPSQAEGFGLPLAEALALGTPVLASDLPVFLETAPRALGLARYIDALDGAAWLQAIRAQAALGAPELQAQRAHIRRVFRAPQWAQHFEAVDEFLAGLPWRQGGSPA